jgi:chromosome segregation ATPase
MKNNSMKRIKELTDELNTEKRRNNDLLKDKSDKEREIQILHAQLDSVLHKHEPTPSVVHPQQKLQTLELQLKRITEENIHLNHQLSQQQQQQFAAPNPGDSSNMKVQVLSEQIKKLSVDNANLEKKVNSNELLAKETQKEQQNLIR